MVTTPTQMRIPPELLAKIDEAARAEGVTRTAWLLAAARRRLTADSILVTGQPVWDVRSPLALREGHRRDDELGEPFDPADPRLWLAPEAE